METNACFSEKFAYGSLVIRDMSNCSTELNGAQPPVYVVDDDDLLREFAALLLHQSGIKCRTFTCAEDALAAFTAAASRPGLIITDYAMAAMNGLQLLERCKQLEPGLKTILVSGTVNESVLQQTRLQVDRFLGKPYRREEFLDSVMLLVNENR